jgi:hypothetical protein
LILGWTLNIEKTWNGLTWVFLGFFFNSSFDFWFLQILGNGILTVGILMKLNIKSLTIELGPATDHGLLTEDVAIVMIVFGVFITTVAGLGLFGACSNSRCMLLLASTEYYK